MLRTATVLSSLGLAAADLPVHCVKHQVLGEWVIEHEPLTASRSKCSHKTPDIESWQPDRKLSCGDNCVKQNVFLDVPDIVKDAKGSRIGMWTMIYDEGFQIKLNVPPHNHDFLAFSRYTLDDVNNLATNTSLCEFTGKGWVQTLASSFTSTKDIQHGCFIAQKVGASEVATYLFFQRQQIF